MTWIILNTTMEVKIPIIWISFIFTVLLPFPIAVTKGNVLINWIWIHYGNFSACLSIYTYACRWPFLRYFLHLSKAPLTSQTAEVVTHSLLQQCKICSDSAAQNPGACPPLHGSHPHQGFLLSFALQKETPTSWDVFYFLSPQTCR